MVFLFLSTYYLVFPTHFAAAQLLQWYLSPYRRSLCTQVSKTVFVSPLARHSLSITPIYSTYFICWTTEIYRLAGTYITLLGYPGCASKHERKPDNIEIKIISLYLLIFYAHPPLLLPFHPQHSLILYCSDIASFKALQYVLIALLSCWNKTKTIGKIFLSFTSIFYYSKNNQSHMDDKQILLGSNNTFFPILRWLRKAYGYQIVNEWSFEFLYSLLNSTEPIPRPYYRSPFSRHQQLLKLAQQFNAFIKVKAPPRIDLSSICIDVFQKLLFDQGQIQVSPFLRKCTHSII